jgi:hypothetical protein
MKESKEKDIMQAPQPSLQEWNTLYRAVLDFWQIQPWHWVDDTDLFGVKNPEDGEILPLFRSYEPGYYPWYLNQQ